MPFLKVRPEQAGRPTGARDDACYEFDWWLGDDLVEAHPDFLVTEALRSSLEGPAPLSGFRVAPARVRESAFLKATPGARPLPRFFRLEIGGAAGADDMGVEADGSLVVSGRCLAVLLGRTLEQAEISQFHPAARGAG
jgi:hypothetical protein